MITSVNIYTSEAAPASFPLKKLQFILTRCSLVPCAAVGSHTVVFVTTYSFSWPIKGFSTCFSLIKM